MNKFTLRLADGRWVSSPTNTATSNANLAGVFTAADDESAAELRGAMERLHGPLELVPWQSKRTDALTRHIENVALMDEAQDPFAGAEVIYAYTRKDALNDGVQIDVSEVAREAGLKFPVYLTRAVWENYVTRARWRALSGRERPAVGHRVDAALCGPPHERPRDALRPARPQRQPRPHASARDAQGRVRPARHRRPGCCHNRPHAR